MSYNKNWTPEDSARMDEAAVTAKEDLTVLMNNCTEEQQRAVALFVIWWSDHMDAGHKRLFKIATGRG